MLLACAHPTPHDDPSGCGACHAGAQQDWQASAHASAHDNALFTEAFRHAQDPWCLGCHDPGGVSCARCHTQGQTCADCHQFDLPGTSVPSQDTVGEHDRSWFAETPCTDCHDPHRAPGAHDVERVRKALSIAVVATGSGTRATLTSDHVGHAVPTGDPFRRLVLEICADLACTRPTDRHVLERSLVEHDTGWAVRDDTRIPPPVGGPTASITVDLAPGRAWRLFHRYADPRHDLDDSVLIDAGVIGAAP